jgi:hypothetical protein
MKTMTEINDFDGGDNCPVHNMPHRKIYTFGSPMSGETEVCTFRGCRCAVSIVFDGFGGGSAMYHTSYDEASGRGSLNAQLCAVKYR